MTSQKFQLTEEYKRKQKSFWIFLALFSPIFIITTSNYATNQDFSWDFFWIEIIAILVIFILLICIIYFAVLQKIFKHWVELDFKEDTFVIFEMGKQKEFFYSEIKEVVFYKNITNKPIYIKLILPKKIQYITGFEGENELIQIIGDKIKEYNIKKTEKLKYIDNSNYYILILQVVVIMIICMLLFHFIYS